MTSWWASPLYQAALKSGQNELSINKLTPPLFGATGIAPVGYAAFGFALGVAAGVLIRRTVPAMAVTLAIFAAIQIFWPVVVRQHLIPPVHSTVPLAAVNFNGMGESNNGQLFLTVGSISRQGGDWVTSGRAVDATGQAAAHVPSACAQMSNTFIQCLQGHGIRMAVTYQPASRYWALQWCEASAFLALALGLGGLCYWRIRRPS